MKTLTYSEKLRDPRWQKRRLEIFKRDEWSCFFCGCNDKTLNVHHIHYNGEPWEAEDRHLVTLCQDCHNTESDMIKYEISCLVNSLKEMGFMSDDILMLRLALNGLSNYRITGNDILLSAIRNILSNTHLIDNEINKIIDNY